MSLAILLTVMKKQEEKMLEEGGETNMFFPKEERTLPRPPFH